MNIPQRPVHIAVAVDMQGGFAKDGKIPWHYKEDMHRFRDLTTNHICVMGRVTYEDMVAMRGEKAKDLVLPNRKSFVLSSTLENLTNATAIKEFNEIEYHLKEEDKDSVIFVIGGQEVYNQHIPRTDIVHLTVINKDFECDRFFPTEYLNKYFKIVNVEDSSDKDMKFITYMHKKYN